MFDSTKEDLKDILRKCDEGKLQLPDFQRDYVWGDEDVRSLIASIAKGFPVGALLTLETGSEVEFKPRLLSGVAEKKVEPDELLLDGQQRITSLYQSTFAPAPVLTKTAKGKQVERHYYLDIKKAVTAQADLYDAIVGVPADRIVRTNFGKDIELNLSSPEREFQQNMFPLHRSFDSRDWFFDWRDYWKGKNENTTDLEKSFYRDVLERIERYKMPIIRLDRKNSREAICLVFEKVNIGGKKLDPFELLTAIYAASNFDLRVAWNGDPDDKKAEPGIKKRLLGHDHPNKVLKKIASTDFLQACTLLHTRQVRLQRASDGATGKDLPQISCNRQSLLGLPLAAFKQHRGPVEQGLIDAAAFLAEQKILGARDVPYPSQVVALATAIAAMGDGVNSIPAKQKLARWYWSGAIGELYGSGTDTRMATDLSGLIGWIVEDGPPPKTVDDAIFQEERLKSLRSRLSAAYKALHALLMRHGCRDFFHGEETELMTYFNRRIDIHHIFPQKWCKNKKIDKNVFDSVINKTPLSKKSNILIGGDAPSVYLERIEKKTEVTPEELDEILRTHLIEPRFLRADDFDGFFNARMEALSGIIGKAMGKPVVTGEGVNEPEVDVEAKDALIDNESE